MYINFCKWDPILNVWRVILFKSSIAPFVKQLEEGSFNY